MTVVGNWLKVTSRSCCCYLPQSSVLELNGVQAIMAISARTFCGCLMCSDLVDYNFLGLTDGICWLIPWRDSRETCQFGCHCCSRFIFWFTFANITNHRCNIQQPAVDSPRSGPWPHCCLSGLYPIPSIPVCANPRDTLENCFHAATDANYRLATRSLGQPN